MHNATKYSLSLLAFIAIICISKSDDYYPLYSVKYSVKYSVYGEGTLQGNTSQTVLYGESTTAVTAIPGDGYIFLAWCDQYFNFDTIKDNPLIVNKISSDMDIYAIFIPIDAHILSVTIGSTFILDGVIAWGRIGGRFSGYDKYFVDTGKRQIQ